MHSTQAFALLALAGTTIASPAWGNWGNYFGHGGNNNNVAATPAADAVEVVTAYTTVTWGGWGGQPTAAPSVTATSVAWKPKETPAAATATPSASAPSTGGSTSGGYMGIVEEWRGKMGLSNLQQDSQLEANALKTAQDGNGEMVHELNKGSMAQVLAPGSTSEFENVFVGGWLCELPSLAGLDGICNTMSAGWSYGGQTGHADILKSGSYSKIGCACATGIWACDLA